MACLLRRTRNVVELPGDTLPYLWAPEIAGLTGPSITEKTNYRLLADAIAHQWCVLYDACVNDSSS